MKKLKITPTARNKMEAGVVFHHKWFENEINIALRKHGFDLRKPMFRVEETDGSLVFYQEEERDEIIKNMKTYAAILLGLIATVFVFLSFIALFK